jgi:homoserine trans-succinylase
MSINKVLSAVSMMALTNHVEYNYSALRGDYTKFQYAGLSKHSPSHAQQKRDSKKAKNKGRKI